MNKFALLSELWKKTTKSRRRLKKMSEFGSINNATADDKPNANNMNNESFAQFGVASPAETGPANFEGSVGGK